MSADSESRLLRFVEPAVAPPGPVRLPAIARSTLPNGMRVWTLPHNALPVVSVAVLVDTGTVDDPLDLQGLGAMTVDMLDEGAGGRDSIHLAEALADLGASVDLSSGADVTSAQLWTVRRQLHASLRVLADIVSKPHLDDHDLTRVRELRLSRLQQLRRSPASAADRVFSAAVFGAHGYAHSGLGTTASVSRIRIDDVRAHYAKYYGAARITLIAAGDVHHDDLVAMAADAFGMWPSTNGAMTVRRRRWARACCSSSARAHRSPRFGSDTSRFRARRLTITRWCCSTPGSAGRSLDD